MKLRIFEQRYLNLVRRSMAQNTGFGVVPILEGREVGKPPRFLNFGTMVKIVDFNQQPDGLLGITIEGVSRFKVLSSAVEDDGLVVANVDPVEQEEHGAPEPEEEDLLRLLNDLITGLQVEDLFADKAPTRAELSWRLASLLPLPKSVTLDLLQQSDEEIRLDIVRECLATLAGSDRTIN